MEWADQLLELRLPAKPAEELGLSLEGDRAAIVALAERAAASDVGLRVGDEIHSINGIRTRSTEHAHEILKRRSIFGDVHQLYIVRPGFNRRVRIPWSFAVLIALCYVVHRCCATLLNNGKYAERDEL